MKKIIIILSSLVIISSLTGCGQFFHSDKIAIEKTDNKLDKQIPKGKINSSKATEPGVTNKNVSKDKLINNTDESSNSKKPPKKDLTSKDKESIEAAVNLTLDDFLVSINKKDILQTMNMLDPYRSDYEDKRVMFNLMFNEFDIKYSIVNKNAITIVNSNKVILKSSIKVENDPRSTVANIINDTIVMENLKGKWKIYSASFYE